MAAFLALGCTGGTALGGSTLAPSLLAPEGALSNETTGESETIAVPVPMSTSARAARRATTPRISVVAIDGAPPVHFVDGGKETHAVIVVLHGRCGQPLSFMPWARAARRHGTLIALTGTIACRGGFGTRWTVDVERLDARVHAAIEAVAQARGEPLDAEDVTLVGYSQGAARAEALAALAPDRYTRLVLVSGPTAPLAENIDGARGVALVAGERDRRTHLQIAARQLSEASLPVRYFMLPGARHGEYGPAAERVMGDALRWVMEQ